MISYKRVLFGISLFFLGIHQTSASIEKKIGVLGTGYVGLVLGTCLAEFGNSVICADIDTDKIEMLKKNQIPIYEPGLPEMISSLTKKGTLTFSDNPEETIRNCQVIFIAVGTPTSEDGKADLSAVKSVARIIGENLNEYKVICTKSTVPIGTSAEIKNIIAHHNQNNIGFDILSNPEFLREGSAVHDFLYPDRVVIGYESEKALTILMDIYHPLNTQKVPFVYTDMASAETIKYASNAFLATKISFINEIANLCEETGANVTKVAEGMGHDTRIGPKFLLPGPGYGGSCFPKDIQALLHKAQSSSIDLKVVGAALEANNAQKMRIVEKISRLSNYDLEGKTVAILGLAFKANTDDIRYSPAITIIESILNAGAFVKGYDPAANSTMQKIIPNIQYCNSPYDAVTNADISVILTEWDEFKTMDLKKIRSLVRQPVLLDTRNLIDINELHQLGFRWENIGGARTSRSISTDN